MKIHRLEKIDFSASKTTIQHLHPRNSCIHATPAPKQPNSKKMSTKPTQRFTFDSDDEKDPLSGSKLKMSASAPVFNLFDSVPTAAPAPIVPAPVAAPAPAPIVPAPVAAPTAPVAAPAPKKTTKEWLTSATNMNQIRRTVERDSHAEPIMFLAMELFFKEVQDGLGLSGKVWKNTEKNQKTVWALMKQDGYFSVAKKAVLAAYDQVKTPDLGFEFDEPEDSVDELTRNMGAMSLVSSKKNNLEKNTLEKDAALAAKLQAEENARAGAMVVSRSNGQQVVIPAGTSSRVLQTAMGGMGGMGGYDQPQQTFNGPVAQAGGTVNVYTIVGATPDQLQQAAAAAARQVAQSMPRSGNDGLSRIGGKPGLWAM